MKSAGTRWWRTSIAVLTLTLIAGCVHETRSGDAVKYTYELWAPLSILFGSIVGIVAGWFLRSASERFAWALIILGVVGLFIGPSMMCDYAVVDSAGCEVRTGFPYFASKQVVKFDDVQQVRETKRVTRGRRGSKSTSYYYNFDLKSGGTVEMKVSGDIRREARSAIDKQLAARGISVVDETGF